MTTLTKIVLKGTMSDVIKARNMLNEVSPALSSIDLNADYFRGNDWECIVIGKNFCVELKDELASWLLLQMPGLKTHK